MDTTYVTDQWPDDLPDQPADTNSSGMGLPKDSGQSVS